MKLWRTRTRTNRAAFVCAALASLVFAGGCGGTRGGPAAGEGPAHTLFRRHCAACHGPDGTGGQVGTLNVPSLRAQPAAEYTDQQLFEQIYKGRGGMPPFSYTLTDEEIRLLARFVREEIQGRR
jgi:cytochrome c oxidase cbb3-type subunit 3